jgi:hypothetical protein
MMAAWPMLLLGVFGLGDPMHPAGLMLTKQETTHARQSRIPGECDETGYGGNPWHEATSDEM